MAQEMAQEEEGVPVSEAQIAVHWREEEYYQPPPKFIGQANASDPGIFERFSEDHFPECYKEYADLLTWDHYWHTTLDTSNPPFWKWFVGGRLNAAYNCVDRHLVTRRNKAALIWVPEPEHEETKAITYQELHRRVNEFAALLRDFAGVKARSLGFEVAKVLVWRRHPGQYASQSPMVSGRDFFVDELLGDYRGRVVEPVSMPAEAPLFLMYTSGTTARPKGCQHSTGGYLAYVTGTSKYYQDIHPQDTYWCFADIGWITGHSYIVYGPLALGATSVMYEGVPAYPDPGRPWRIAQRLGVNIFHTAPTTIRMLRKLGPDEPKKYNYHFKHMTTVGEPIEPEVWRWYYNVVGKGKAIIVDTWWQTENGGFLGSTLPALQPMKPGSCGPGVLGIYPVIYDEQGEVVEAGSGRAGNICICNPWPGIFQTIWGQPERFVEIYYEKYCRDKNSKKWQDWPYFAGDGAVLAADGYFRILGRVDDVINVAGHRLGTKEIESACLTVEEIAEAAAVPMMDELRGWAVEVYVALKPGFKASKDIEERVARAIEKEIGKIARPRNIWIVADMPKTRSGKIMRRVLASVSNFTDVGDVTTLANPEIVESIRRYAQSEKLARGELPRVLSKEEIEEIKLFGSAE